MGKLKSLYVRLLFKRQQNEVVSRLVSYSKQKGIKVRKSKNGIFFYGDTEALTSTKQKGKEFRREAYFSFSETELLEAEKDTIFELSNLTKKSIENMAISVPPKGYIRGHGIARGETVYTKLFRLASAKETVEKEGVGKVSVFIKNGENYAFAHELGIYIFAGNSDERSIKAVVEALNNVNVNASVFTDISDRIKNAPKPFVRVITKKTVAKINKLSRLMNSKLVDITDTLLKVEDGIVTISDGDSTVVSKVKLDIPNIAGMSVKELRKVKDELYINEEGRFSDGTEFISSTLDFEQVSMVDIIKTDLTIKMTQSILKSLQTAVKAVDNNNPKFEINGLLLDVTDGKAKAVGTDTRRLTISKEFNIKGRDGQYIILPQQVAKDTKVIKAGEGLKGNMVAYSETEEYELHTKNIHGKYPDYKRIVPTGMKHNIRVDTKELENIKGEIYIQVEDDKVYWATIDTHIKDISNSKKHPIKTISIDSEDICFAINSKYLKDAMQGSDKVTIGVNEKKLPITVYGELGTTIIMTIVTEAVTTDAIITYDELKKVEPTEPTDKQKEAGNYKKFKLKIKGRIVTIENPAGSGRSGVDTDGKKWSILMQDHYGYFNNTEGADGDHIDVFLNSDANEEELNERDVFTVHQNDVKTGKYDEDKVILGCKSETHAKEVYLRNYEVDYKGFGSIKKVDDLEAYLDTTTHQIKNTGEMK